MNKRRVMAMRKAEKRIVWYTRKVAELGAVHPIRRTDKDRRRGERLLRYKLAMNEWLRGVQ